MTEAQSFRLHYSVATDRELTQANSRIADNLDVKAAALRASGANRFAAGIEAQANCYRITARKLWQEAELSARVLRSVALKTA